jgi:hypothetical protein
MRIITIIIKMWSPDHIVFKYLQSVIFLKSKKPLSQPQPTFSIVVHRLSVSCDSYNRHQLICGSNDSQFWTSLLFHSAWVHYGGRIAVILVSPCSFNFPFCNPYDRLGDMILRLTLLSPVSHVLTHVLLLTESGSPNIYFSL